VDVVRTAFEQDSGAEPWVRPVAENRDTVVANLFVMHHRRLVGLASLLVDDRRTAEDVVQEAFLGLYRRWHKLRDPDAAVTFLNRSVVNGGRDTLRRRRRGGAAMVQLVPRSEELASAEQAVVDHAEQDQLWAAVADLPMRQRQVLVLRYYLDQSEAEIADTLGISRGSVKKHASRGIAALSSQWEARS
jgi:RNA polymerase sigma-70 factor (sigma-E family)